MHIYIYRHIHMVAQSRLRNEKWTIREVTCVYTYIHIHTHMVAQTSLRNEKWTIREGTRRSLLSNV